MFSAIPPTAETTDGEWDEMAYPAGAGAGLIPDSRPSPKRGAHDATSHIDYSPAEGPQRHPANVGSMMPTAAFSSGVPSR